MPGGTAVASGSTLPRRGRPNRLTALDTAARSTSALPVFHEPGRRLSSAAHGAPACRANARTKLPAFGLPQPKREAVKRQAGHAVAGGLLPSLVPAAATSAASDAMPSGTPGFAIASIPVLVQQVPTTEEQEEQRQTQQQQQPPQAVQLESQKQLSATSGTSGTSVGATPAFCEEASLGGLLQQFQLRQEGFDSGLQLDGLLAYYRRLGCSPEQVQAAVVAAAPGRRTRQQGGLEGEQEGPEGGAGDGGSWGAFAGVEAGPAPLPPFLPTTPQQQLQLAAWELLAAAAAAAALSAYQARPRGWARQDLLEVRSSPIAGRGVFARAPIPAGTVLGSYPGRLRSGAEMLAKCETAPAAASYAFRTGDGRFLDPTDALGNPSPHPQPGWPWPLPTDVTLAFVNEPPKSSPGTNASVEDGGGAGELLFVASVEIPAGAEVLIDYGISYDRSRYGRG